MIGTLAGAIARTMPDVYIQPVTRTFAQAVARVAANSDL